MSLLKGACVIAQSGGPTAVINSSVLGFVEAALEHSDCITGIYGAAHGIKGVIADKLYDLGAEDKNELELLKFTPSSALGSCRYKLADFEKDDSDYSQILQTFRKHNIRYFFYNGGNDSMDTCNKISKYMLKNGYECRIIGIPKTIDNDLYITDHCPGYGSAAKYIATATMEINLDARVYDTGTVTVLEVMGRNAGWLTAATALAQNCGAGPDLIFLPEIPFNIQNAFSSIEKIYSKTGKCIVAVSEGIRDESGTFITEYDVNMMRQKDSFGHVQMGGLAETLSRMIKHNLGIPKVRGIEFSLTQRCAAHCASLTDIEEARLAGRVAVESAVSGETDKMVAFVRTGFGNNYKCDTKLVGLTDVANLEKKIPNDWLLPTGDGVNDKFIEYALPLIQGDYNRPLENGLPRFAKLKKSLV